MAPPDISLVIPAFNEERFLPRLLDSVAVARGRFAAGGGVLEVIVADNLSSDGTARIAAERGCRVVEVTTRNIGAVRNGGVRAALAPVVATVDADHRLHPDTFVAVARCMASPRIIAGSSGARPERWSLGIAATFAILAPLAFLTGIDTGVVFCRREDFDAVGGYDETKPIAEDVAFLWALKRRGWRRGQRLVRTRDAKVIASMRKFDEHGDWHYFGLFRRVPKLLRRRRLSDGTLAYWYKPKR